mgnify:CR=1 FL=1
MEYTKNLKLHKPSYDDDVDIQVLNNNMDLLDDKVGNLPYLPLAGGTMKGDIKLPYNTWVGLHSTRSVSEERLNDVFCFANTTNNGVQLPSVVLRSDRLSYYTPSDKMFAVDDTGVWFNNDSLIRDLYSVNDEFSGYTKLSTGLLLQWGFVNPRGSTYNIQHATFKLPMASSSYAVFTSRSFYTGNLSSNRENRWGSSTFNFTTTGFDICCAEPSAYGTAEFWLAIGRHK